MMTATPRLNQSEPFSSLMAGRHVITAMETYGTFKNKEDLCHLMYV